MGLVPIKVAIWGPFVLINFGATSNDSPYSEGVGNEWLGDAAEILSANGVDTSLKYLCRRTYILECNWKVRVMLKFTSVLCILLPCNIKGKS